MRFTFEATAGTAPGSADTAYYRFEFEAKSPRGANQWARNRARELGESTGSTVWEWSWARTDLGALLEGK